VSDAEEPTKVAIACQGGGSHTAFTAGVLERMLERWDDERYELVGISGTSGGAFNAVGTWYGLVTGDRNDAIDVLNGLWSDLAAKGVNDRVLNGWLTGYSRLEGAGFPLPMTSPYQVAGDELSKQRIVDALERHIDFDAVPELCGPDCPELVVGTVNVNEGIFETFTNSDVTPKTVLASAAVPNLFEAVKLNGHYHWDGLFSQNPPVDDLLKVPRGSKPDELWVIQINPQEYEGEPASLDAIADRRNELSGNISLNQELRSVARINTWIEEGYLPEDQFKYTEIHRIEMGQRYSYSTKLDRRPAFLAELWDLGRSQAEAFLDERQA
jgi:NTE family protein